MENINKYLDMIEVPWYMRSKITASIYTAKRFFGEDIKINHIFISNWQNNDTYEYGDSLWIFTSNQIIEFLNFKVNNDCDVVEFKVHTLQSAILVSRIESISYYESSIEMKLPSGELIKLRGIGSNQSYLIDIHKELIGCN